MRYSCWNRGMLSGHRSPPHISAPLGIQLSRCKLGTGVRLIDFQYNSHLDRVKRIWYLSRAAKVQASLRIRAVSPEPSLLAHTSSESRGTFRQKPRSLAPLNGWACAVKICHDGMLEDTNSLDGAHLIVLSCFYMFYNIINVLLPCLSC